MKFLSILKRAATEATSAELRAALDEIDLGDAEREVAKLEAEYRRVLLSGTATDVEAIERKIAEANRDVVRKSAAIEELSIRIEAAEAAEMSTAVDAKITENRQLADSMKLSVVAVHDAAMALANALRELQRQETLFKDGNDFVRAHGRPEVQHPLAELAAATGAGHWRDLQHVFVLPEYLQNPVPKPLLGEMRALLPSTGTARR